MALAAVALPPRCSPPPVPGRSPPPATRTVSVQVVPAEPGVAFTLDGIPGVTGADGTAAVVDPNLNGAAARLVVPNQTLTPTLRIALDRVANDPHHGNFTRRLLAELDEDRAVTIAMLTPKKKTLPLSEVTSATITDSLGGTLQLTRAQLSKPIWLPASRPAQWQREQRCQRTRGHLRVQVRDHPGRQCGQQRPAALHPRQVGHPQQALLWQVPVILHSLTIEANDLLAGRPWPRPYSSPIRTTRKVTVPLGPHAGVHLPQPAPGNLQGEGGRGPDRSVVDRAPVPRPDRHRGGHHQSRCRGVGPHAVLRAGRGGGGRRDRTPAPPALRSQRGHDHMRSWRSAHPARLLVAMVARSGCLFSPGAARGVPPRARPRAAEHHHVTTTIPDRPTTAGAGADQPQPPDVRLLLPVVGHRPLARPARAQLSLHGQPAAAAGHVERGRVHGDQQLSRVTSSPTWPIPLWTQDDPDQIQSDVALRRGDRPGRVRRQLGRNGTAEPDGRLVGLQPPPGHGGGGRPPDQPAGDTVFPVDRLHLLRPHPDQRRDQQRPLLSGQDLRYRPGLRPQQRWRPTLIMMGSRKYPQSVLDAFSARWRAHFYLVGDENWNTWDSAKAADFDADQYYWSSQNPVDQQGLLRRHRPPGRRGPLHPEPGRECQAVLRPSGARIQQGARWGLGLRAPPRGPDHGGPLRRQRCRQSRRMDGHQLERDRRGHLHRAPRALRRTEPRAR